MQPQELMPKLIISGFMLLAASLFVQVAYIGNDRIFEALKSVQIYLSFILILSAIVYVWV